MLAAPGAVDAGLGGGARASAADDVASEADDPDLVPTPDVPPLVRAGALEEARAAADAGVDAAHANVETTAEALELAEDELAEVHDQQDEVDRLLEVAEAQLAELGVAAYTTAGADDRHRGAAALLGPATDPGATAERTVRIALDEVEAELRRLVAERAELADEEPRRAAAVERAERVAALARASVPVAERTVEGVEAAGRALAAGAPVGITDLRFPVAGPHRYVDSWGFARSGGRRHEGTDVFAAHGTPAVAVEAGTVERVGTNGLGGQVLWLRGESGTTYYYAHLSGHAVGAGQQVAAGAVVAYVGESGNAAGTGAHLHFEVHPGGGGPTNPYPLLAAAPLAEDQPRLPGG